MFSTLESLRAAEAFDRGDVVGGMMLMESALEAYALAHRQ